MEGLPTFIVYNEWNKPEDVKKVIVKLYKKDKLEGVVFAVSPLGKYIQSPVHMGACHLKTIFYKGICFGKFHKTTLQTTFMHTVCFDCCNISFVKSVPHSLFLHYVWHTPCNAIQIHIFKITVSYTFFLFFLQESPHLCFPLLNILFCVLLFSSSSCSSLYSI